MEEAGDVVFHLDRHGDIAFASQRATALLARPAALGGAALAKRVCEADQAPLAAALAEIVESGSARLLEVRFKTPDAEIWHELRISRYATAQDVAGLLVVGRDMTIQHATEQRLRHMATHDALT